MSISKSQLEYYRYYCASQRRVEQWVQDTERVVSQNSSEPPSTQWLGFLEDPGLVTPISPPPLPLDHIENHHHHAGTVPPPRHHQASEIERMDSHKTRDVAAVGPRAAGERRPLPFTMTSNGSHDDAAPPHAGSRKHHQTRTNERSLVVVVDRAVVPPAQPSSKNSKDSKRTESKSRNSSSGSASRKRHLARREDAHRPILAYIPYGIIPFLFVMTTGSSAVSLAAASIMITGYFCLDTRITDERPSRK